MIVSRWMYMKLVLYKFKLAIIKDYVDAFEGFRRKWAPEKSKRGSQTAVRTPKILNFSACKAQINQHEIRIAFFERDY